MTNFRPSPYPHQVKRTNRHKSERRVTSALGMIQCRDAFRDMRTTKWLTLAPHCHYSGHTFRRRPFQMKNDRRDRTLPSHTNGYLYAEKNRPHPICLPFQHHEYPIRIQQFEADDNWDITDIDGIKNETPMVLIQRYNGFWQGIRNNRLGSITEEEEEEEETSDVEKTQRSKENLGTLYSRHRLGSTTDYESADEEDVEYDGDVSKFESQRVRKHHVSNLVHFQREAQSVLRAKSRFPQIVNEKWPHNYPVHIRNVDNFLLHRPITSAKTSEIIEYGLNPESYESKESKVCDSDEFSSKEKTQVQENFQPTSSKINNCNSFCQILSTLKYIPGDVDNHKESIGNTFESFNQNKKATDSSLQMSEGVKEIPVKFFSNNLTGNVQTVKVEDKHITSASDSTDDNFYKTFLPSSLAENETVTKINPIAFLCANQNGEENAPKRKEIEIIPMEDEDNGECFEKIQSEFVYSVEEFPHPPDHFFDDCDSLSSVSMVTGTYEEEKRENSAGSLLMKSDGQIYRSNGHLTFVVTNQNNDESIDSSSDCFSEFARQSSRDSDFVSESVSTEFTFEANPSEQKPIHTIPITTFQTTSDDYLENSDSSLKCGMLSELNYDGEKTTRQDTENLEDMYSKRISDTILQSCLSLKKSISSRMKHQENIILPQCGKHPETCLHKNKNIFDIISTNNFNQALKKKKCRIKTNGRCSHNESDLKSKYDESGSFDCKKAKSASILHQSEEGDQITKSRLSAVQNMLQRATTIDKVCYAPTDNSSRKRGGQSK